MTTLARNCTHRYVAAMLERVALHQTRLRTPGMTLDAKGVALGAKGMVLLPSLDRLIAFLALLSSGAALPELAPSLRIEIVRSQLGNREVLLSFATESSSRMDSVAEVARMAGGFVFTGTSRHFVKYRDAAAPFGYDAMEIAATDAPNALYHDNFSQHYAPDKSIALGALVKRLQPRVAPETIDQRGRRWIVAEAGIGAALIHYFVRSQVEAVGGMAEWPPESGFDETPRRRYLFRLDKIPERMLGLLCDTPGVDVFAEAGPGSAVQLGYEHPINLRSCPVFADDELVLIRGGERAPLTVEKVPTLGPVAAFARVALHDEQNTGVEGTAGRAVDSVAIDLKLAPDTGPWRRINGTCVGRNELGLLRQIAYRLSPTTIDQTRIALCEHGAYLIRAAGIEAVPVGEMFRQYHHNIFVSAGYTPVPAVQPDVLFSAFGSPESQLLFLHRDGRHVGLPEQSFVPLAAALLDAESWSGTTPEAVVRMMTTALPQLVVTPVGVRPLRDVAPVAGGESES